MGGEVEQQLVDTLKAVKHNHAALAEKVVLNDLKIKLHGKFKLTKSACALLQNVILPASDLRLIMTISKAITDIERNGR